MVLLLRRQTRKRILLQLLLLLTGRQLHILSQPIATMRPGAVNVELRRPPGLDAPHCWQADYCEQRWEEHFVVGEQAAERFGAAIGEIKPTPESHCTAAPP